MISWISSFPKSGNTWARMLVKAYVSNLTQPINIKEHVLGTGDATALDYQAATSVPLGRINNKHTWPLLRGAALINMINRHDERPLFVKSHFANVDVNDIPMIPNEITKNALYLVRDPRDVAASYSNHVSKSVDEVIEAMGTDGVALPSGGQVPQYTCSWSTNVKSWALTPKPYSILIVKYEELLENPSKELENIIDHFFPEEIIDTNRVYNAVRQTAFKKLKNQEINNGGYRDGTGNFFNRGQSGYWKEILTTDQVNKINNDHGEVMEELGYNA